MEDEKGLNFKESFIYDMDLEKNKEADNSQNSATSNE